MRVRFRVNLGSRDALPLELDFRECVAGAELDISETAARALRSVGVVELLEEPVIAAVPPEPVQVAPAPEPKVKGRK